MQAEGALPRMGKAARETFLAHLAATADVELAAAAAGVTVAAAYAAHRRDTAFAQGWREALGAGYDRVEAALIRRALGVPAAAELDVPLALALAGELIEDRTGALWTRALLERQRVRMAPAAVRVVVGVDPPAGIGGDACGIVAVAKAADGCAYVIEDASVAGATPDGWARAVAGCAERVAADRVVAEGNQGGEMVRHVLTGVVAGLPITIVHARHGKVTRAEPVAALYERGQAWHAGTFPALEDELCGFVRGGYEGPGRSPDRADACVWAMTELMLGRRGEAGVRGL